MFRKGQYVLAKCQNYPYWPGQILSYKASEDLYKVTFVGESSYATINSFYVMPFSEAAARSILLQGDNHLNKKLKRSINIAIRKAKTKQKQINSQVLSEEGAMDEQMTPDVQPTGISSNISHRPVAKVNCPPKKIEGKRVPEKIATEALRLMSRLMDDMTALDSQKKALAFLPEEESNLRKILELGEISLFNFVEDHLLEKMIMVIKVYDAFKVDCVANKEIVGLILEKYQQMKNLILQGQFLDEEIPTSMREYILLKLTNFKAYI